MNEHTDADEQIVSLGCRNEAFRNRIGNGLGDGVLGRAEHLHRLLGALDRHLVEQHRVGLGRQIGRDHRQQGGEPVLVVGQAVAKRSLDRTAARTDQQVDVSDFVPIADQRLAHTNFGDLGHLLLP